MAAFSPCDLQITAYKINDGLLKDNVIQLCFSANKKTGDWMTKQYYWPQLLQNIVICQCLADQ